MVLCYDFNSSIQLIIEPNSNYCRTIFYYLFCFHKCLIISILVKFFFNFIFFAFLPLFLVSIMLIFNRSIVFIHPHFLSTIITVIFLIHKLTMTFLFLFTYLKNAIIFKVILLLTFLKITKF